MAERTKPPFRADHVGSLLRPKMITNGFKKLHAGEITQDEFKSIQDNAIQDVIKLQENAGLKSITDGEFRRNSYWHTFVERVEGLEVKEALFTFRDNQGNEQSFTAPHVGGKGGAPNRSQETSSSLCGVTLRKHQKSPFPPRLPCTSGERVRASTEAPTPRISNSSMTYLLCLEKRSPPSQRQAAPISNWMTYR